MARLPRISVVTPSFNQGRYLEHTVRSVLDQNYPDVEHVVVDNLSTDETPAVLARHPHLRVIREADRGQAEAINKGFRRTTGEILCFLNSDDRLLPGALHRVARALDPRTGPHVVTGRCPYIDENDRPTGVEHPSAVLGHWRVLKSWQGHWLPQPATFWTRAAWDRCGPLDESEHLVMDYDLMCRLSRHYRFAFIDEPLAAYRLHSESKTCTNDADRINAAALRASKRYWGAYLGPRRWFLVASLIRHRLEAALRLRRRAADLVFRAEAARAAGRPVRALLAQSLAAALAPAVALRRCVRLRRAHRHTAEPGVWTGGALSPRAASWRGFTALHADGYAGPTVRIPFRTERGQRWLRLDGAPVLGWLPGPTRLDVTADGRPIARYALPPARPFALAVPVAGLAPGPHELCVAADAFVLVDDYLGNDDCRPLAYWFGGLRSDGAPGAECIRPAEPALTARAA